MPLVNAVQRLIDAVVAASLTVAGVMMLAGYAAPQPVTDVLLYAGALVWAAVLTSSAFAALLGAALRTERPGRRQDAAFQLELAGWAFCALCLSVYTVTNAFSGGSVAGVAALTALTASLGGKYLRRWAAIHAARQQHTGGDS